MISEPAFTSLHPGVGPCRGPGVLLGSRVTALPFSDVFRFPKLCKAFLQLPPLGVIVSKGRAKPSLGNSVDVSQCMPGSVPADSVSPRFFGGTVGVSSEKLGQLLSSDSQSNAMHWHGSLGLHVEVDVQHRGFVKTLETVSSFICFG